MPSWPPSPQNSSLGWYPLSPLLPWLPATPFPTSLSQRNTVQPVLDSGCPGPCSLPQVSLSLELSAPAAASPPPGVFSPEALRRQTRLAVGRMTPRGGLPSELTAHPGPARILQGPEPPRLTVHLTLQLLIYAREFQLHPTSSPALELPPRKLQGLS